MTKDTDIQIAFLLENLLSEHAEAARVMTKSGKFQFHFFDYYPAPATRKELPQYEEYESRARKLFLKTIARENAGDLFAAGIDHVGIACLHMGRTPYNKDGKLYKVAVDHIINLSSHGPDARKATLSSLYPCNLPSNLILTNPEVDNLKGDFTAKQILAKRKARPGPRRVLTLVPKNYPHHRPVNFLFPPETIELGPDEHIEKTNILLDSLLTKLVGLRLELERNQTDHQLWGFIMNGIVVAGALLKRSHEIMATGKDLSKDYRTDYKEAVDTFKIINGFVDAYREAYGVNLDSKRPFFPVRLPVVQENKAKRAMEPIPA